MVLIRFADQESKSRALGYIARRFPGKSWATGEVMVPEAALASLALEGFHFIVEGPATYERLTSLRDTPATAVQWRPAGAWCADLRRAMSNSVRRP